MEYSFQVDSEIVKKAFDELPNFKIEIGGGKTTVNQCVIYFTGNSLYFPNDEKAFRYSVLEHDYYEWKNLKFPNVKKHIFVRDIFKQWYLGGINSQLNSAEKVAEFLRKETEGMEVITVGSSAGGYAAILFGDMLGAKRVYAFSPRIEMMSLFDTPPTRTPLVHRLKDTDRRKYMDLGTLLNFKDTDVYCFCPTDSSMDIIQYARMNETGLINNPKFHLLRFNTSKHGVPFPKVALPYIFRLPESKLEALFSTGKVVNPLMFSVKMAGVFRTVAGVSKQLYHGYIKKKFARLFSK